MKLIESCYIAGRTVQTAIDASRPEASTQISNSKAAVRDVSESQGQYCDTSAEADLVLSESSVMIIIM